MTIRYKAEDGSYKVVDVSYLEVEYSDGCRVHNGKWVYEDEEDTK